MMSLPVFLFRVFPLGLLLLLLLSCGSPDESAPDAAAGALADIEALESDFARLMQEHPNHPEYQPKARYLAEEYRMFAEQWPQHPQAPEMLFRAANLQADALGRYGIAVNLFRQLAERWPDAEQAPRAQFLVGYTYHHEMDDTPAARKAYEAFISRYPESELRPAVEDELAFMQAGKDIEDIIRQ